MECTFVMRNRRIDISFLSVQWGRHIDSIHSDIKKMGHVWLRGNWWWNIQWCLVVTTYHHILIFGILIRLLINMLTYDNILTLSWLVSMPPTSFLDLVPKRPWRAEGSWDLSWYMNLGGLTRIGHVWMESFNIIFGLWYLWFGGIRSLVCLFLLIQCCQ